MSAIVDGFSAVGEEEDGKLFERVVFWSLGLGDVPGNFGLEGKGNVLLEECDAVYARERGGGCGYENKRHDLDRNHSLICGTMYGVRAVQDGM